MSVQNSNPEGTKTFTQDEVNAIVQERLGREKAKFETQATEREQQLAHREFMLDARETLTAKGLPLSLLDALNTTSKEAFEKSLAILEENKQAMTPPPPPYASDTGKGRMLYDNSPDVLRQGFGLNKQE